MTSQDEVIWLRYRVMRMRTALRFAMSPEVESILRELITDGEARLAILEAQKDEQPRVKPI
jgi:hypothetical protein